MEFSQCACMDHSPESEEQRKSFFKDQDSNRGLAISGEGEHICDNAADPAKSEIRGPWQSGGSRLAEIITEMLRSALAWESEQQN